MQQASTQPTGYKITVMGEYTARGPQGKISKFFKKEEFVLPEISTYRLGNIWEFYMVKNQKKKRSIPNIITQNSMHCYKHLLKKYYLPPRLREKHEDFIRVRTFNVMKKERIYLTAEHTFRDLKKVAIEDMTESELLQFIAMNDLTLEIGHYPDLADKRQAVEMAWGQIQTKAQEKTEVETFDANMIEPSGVMIKGGIVSSEDGTPTDDESRLNAFL